MSFRGGMTANPTGLCEFGHQGLMHDEVVDLIHNRARTLHPRLARFTQRDPLGYVDGMYIDPTGTTRRATSDMEVGDIVKLIDEALLDQDVAKERPVAYANLYMWRHGKGKTLWYPANWLANADSVKERMLDVLNHKAEGWPKTLRDNPPAKGKTIRDYWIRAVRIKGAMNSPKHGTDMDIAFGNFIIQGQGIFNCLDSRSVEGWVRWIMYDRYDWQQIASRGYGKSMEFYGKGDHLVIQDAAFAKVEEAGKATSYENRSMWLQKIKCNKKKQRRAKRIHTSGSVKPRTHSLARTELPQARPSPPQFRCRARLWRRSPMSLPNCLRSTWRADALSGITMTC
jgi:RHS repeat-associated protein